MYLFCTAKVQGQSLYLIRKKDSTTIYQYFVRLLNIRLSLYRGEKRSSGVMDTKERLSIDNIGWIRMPLQPLAILVARSSYYIRM